ncbi:MAG: hypothetical protein RDV48_16535 [Candidatus Eremiobacteraeota bacterium]|nr:hypothetical protein [Candidatus Eremiobacteraeota bacterium]
MKSDRKREMARKALFFLLTLLLALFVLEVSLRFLVKPSPVCFGTLLGGELPPFVIAPDRMAEIEKETHTPAWEASKTEIALRKRSRAPLNWSPEDLRSIHREDKTLGYVPQENSTSPHGWWHANNMGARSSRDCGREKPRGKKRILLFGDSFTHCCRVPLEETWPYMLEEKSTSLEALNFAVEGYGTAQCYLRYMKLKKELDYDAAALVTVPGCDLERDINTYRILIGWQAPNIMPRFLLKNQELVLIKSPYAGKEQFIAENRGHISETLRKHLCAYDSFYIPVKYESPPLLGSLISYKLIARSYFTGHENSLRTNIFDPTREAVKVTGEIIKAMRREVKGDRKDFILFFLPIHDEIRRYKKEPAFRKRWDNAISALAGRDLQPVDLMKPLSELDESSIDTGYDGSHYGPVMNSIITGHVESALKNIKIIP